MGQNPSSRALAAPIVLISIVSSGPQFPPAEGGSQIVIISVELKCLFHATALRVLGTRKHACHQPPRDPPGPRDFIFRGEEADGAGRLFRRPGDRGWGALPFTLGCMGEVLPFPAALEGLRESPGKRELSAP